MISYNPHNFSESLGPGSTNAGSDVGHAANNPGICTVKTKVADSLCQDPSKEKIIHSITGRLLRADDSLNLQAFRRSQSLQANPYV